MTVLHSNNLDVIEKSVFDLFNFLKKSETLKKCWLNSIEVNSDLFLIPISQANYSNKTLLTALTSWRNLYKHTYPTQFVATINSTERWILKNILENPNKILFKIIDGSEIMLGHIGLNFNDKNRGSIEIDNVAISPDSKRKGIMSKCLKKLIQWCKSTLPVNDICLKVLESNKEAQYFYLRNGFHQVYKIPLRRNEIQKRIELVADEEANDDAFIVMKFKEKTQPGLSMILTAGPSISQMESMFAYDAAANGWNANWSDYLKQFEKEFATYIGSKYAIATSSCTGALQIALLALDVGAGDEVIVPDETWVASATAVRDVGAIPIFCDVDLNTYNINVESFKSKITEKTRAVIPVHMYGNPSDMKTIMEISSSYSIKVIEDAAPAIGAKIGEQCCGTFGDFGCFSFQGAKMLVTGEGGMLVTNNIKLFTKAQKIADQGRDPNKIFWINEQGVKFKMSNVQAAIGLAQIRRSELQIYMKRRINNWYRSLLCDIDCIEFQNEYLDSNSIYWMTSIRLLDNSPITRDELMKRLKIMNIDTRPLFPAISQYPIWSQTYQANPNALVLGETAMNLPSGVKLNYGEIEYICNCIKKCLELE